MNQLKAGALLSYMTMFLGFGISIIYTPYMLRKLGMSEYGLYTLVISTISYLTLMSFGLGAAYIRNYSKYKLKNELIKIDELNGMFLSVFAFLGIIALAVGSFLSTKVGFIFGDALSLKELETAKILMFILTLNISLTFPRTVFNVYIQANERFIFSKLLQIFNTVVTPLMTVFILVIGFKSKGIASITLYLQIITFLWSIIYCKRSLKMKIKFNNFDFKLMKEILFFSSFIFMNMIINQINWNVDKLLLGRFWGTSMVAVYGIAAQLNVYFLSVSTVISNVFVPRVNKIVAKGNSDKELTDLFTRIGRVQFIIMSLMLSGLYIFGKAFIGMWAGEEYIDAYYILMILITPLIVPLIQNIGIEIQRAKNMHKFRAIVYFIIAIINVGVSIPLSKSYGGVGAAIGTAGALIIGNIFIMNIYYHKRLGLNMKYFWKEIFSMTKALIIPILLGVHINVYYDLNNVFNFIILGLLYVTVHIVSMWFLGMNKSEKELIVNPIRSILKKCKVKETN
jgi:O-antigen/teichoic acid export membrane protein